MVIVSKINYHLYARFSTMIMVVSIILLILVAIPGIGTVQNNARRWLFGFQPSELAKITIIILLFLLDCKRMPRACARSRD